MSLELNQSILAAALEGFEGQLAKLQGQIAFVKAQISGKGAAAPAPKDDEPKAAKAAKGKKKKGRAVSEEGRLRMAEAQKRRWAKVHAAKAK